MTDLPDIGRLLGSIESTVAETRNQVVALASKFDKVNEEVIEHRGAIKLLGKTVNDEVLPQIEDYKNGKNRLLGAMFGTGIAGGGIGTGLLLWVQKMFGIAPPLPPGHP